MKQNLTRKPIIKDATRGAEAPQGRRHGGDWRGTVSHSSQSQFCKSSRTDEKKLGVWGGVTSLTIFEFQPEFVTSGFQRSDLTCILSNLFFITDLLNLFFGFWNSCSP